MRNTPYASKLYRWLLKLTREVFQDFKYTLRLWASRPWHAGLATTALAIGIGKHRRFQRSRRVAAALTAI